MTFWEKLPLVQRRIPFYLLCKISYFPTTNSRGRCVSIYMFQFLRLGLGLCAFLYRFLTWLQVLKKQLEWSSFSRDENDSHSSWVTASSWSPGWRGCGPGCSGWFCPCTVAGVSWFLPVPSGLPLTGERAVYHTHFNFSLSTRYTIIL